MDYDAEKVDEVILALLYLNAFEDNDFIRAWKNLDWDALDRLYEGGYISDPKSKAKSVVFTDVGLQAAETLFARHFGL